MRNARLKAVADGVVGWLATVLLKTIRLTNPDRMTDIAGGFMRRVGPWLPEHKIGRDNLVAAFPEKSPAEIEAILGGVWDNLGRFAIEVAHLDRIWDYYRDKPGTRIVVPPEVLKRFEHMRDDGKPSLIFAAHLANWELPAVVAGLDTDSAIVYRRPNIGNIDHVLRDIRSINMGTLIPTGMDAPSRAANALARGTHVGMLVDQFDYRGVDVTFFGRRTKANPFIARLARHVDCPIYGARMIRLPNHRFSVELTEPMAPIRDTDGNVDVGATMQMINTIIEGWVREHPEQWLWLHRRWR